MVFKTIFLSFKALFYLNTSATAHRSDRLFFTVFYRTRNAFTNAEAAFKDDESAKQYACFQGASGARLLRLGCVELLPLIRLEAVL